MNSKQKIKGISETAFKAGTEEPRNCGASADVVSASAHDKESSTSVKDHFVQRDGEPFYCIENSDQMPEFFMTLTSASDHWMFVSSFGALTAGRIDPNGALFPYYSADKIADLRNVIGPISIFRLDLPTGAVVWEPFAQHSLTPQKIQRNLYKNSLSNKLIFEEINFDLGLSFQYQWSFSHQFGFVRSCQLNNFGSNDVAMELLDGLQNVLPPALDQQFQLRFSNLADAYKRNERIVESGLGIFYLNSIPTDCAEPSEGLRANVVWQTGLESPKILLSSRQVAGFRHGDEVVAENDIRGQRGSYLVVKPISLAAGEKKSWNIISNVDLDQTDVVNLNRQLCVAQHHQHVSGVESPAMELVRADVDAGQYELEKIVSAADGIQVGGDQLRVNRHRSNVLFNVMRGGIPINGYRLDKADFVEHIKGFNLSAYNRARVGLNELPAEFSLAELNALLKRQNDLDLTRLGMEYLPLTFSRRHGDPTRPWNFFSIATMRSCGKRNLDYQGNWRDIFQNWEALARSYPRFTESMVFRFVNASTADGYNPYRLTKRGFEWEAPDPADPWANIGYWGDHQIIYLLKLLECSHDFSPARLNQWLNVPVCTYAQVPYRIRSYEEILVEPRQTIEFDAEQANEIDVRVRKMGADGKLLRTSGDEICRVTLGEKLLSPALAKLTNFVPGGGIWLNTQRPEWNDANNALVGNGLSVVTVCHLRRYFAFLKTWFQSIDQDSIQISMEVHRLLTEIQEVMKGCEDVWSADQITDLDRHTIVEKLSRAGSEFRKTIYSSGLSGETTILSLADCVEFFDYCLKAIDQTIRINRRDDGLYHSYNLLSWNNDATKPEVGFKVEHLYKMLEGQVAVLSSGLLSPVEAVEILDALRGSSLYRANQDSYLLYPDRDLPSFVEKNQVPQRQIEQSRLLQQLVRDGDESLIREDVLGQYHFQGQIRNVADVVKQLKILALQSRYEILVAEEGKLISNIFESVFDHQRFTGRSGTFFGYEGLGSIYWHMVSKLVLAISENVASAQAQSADPQLLSRLMEHYRQSRDGLGLTKTPREYGAIPTDPYSHTPGHAGAQQPGMTGQVKEDILSRFSELGIRIHEGRLSFDPLMLEEQEWTTSKQELDFIGQNGDRMTIPIPANSFAFTFCQTPVIYFQSDQSSIRIFSDGGTTDRNEVCLTDEETRHLFDRDGTILKIEVSLAMDQAARLRQRLAQQSHLNHANRQRTGGSDD